MAEQIYTDPIVDSTPDFEHDGIQHGIDDNPTHDAEKGGIGGAVAGAVVGGLAGGPVGVVVGAVAGGLASAAGVAAVDRVDNDDTISGLGDGVTPKHDDLNVYDEDVAPRLGDSVTVDTASGTTVVNR